MAPAIAPNPPAVHAQLASGSARCASNPAETSTSFGRYSRPSGTATCSTSEQKTSSPDPDGTGMFTVNPVPAREPTSDIGPVPGYSGDWWIEQYRTSSVAWKMSFV